MNKKNKIITAALAAGTIGAGASIAAVAQACNTDESNGQTTAENKITILTAVNLIAGYTGGTIDDNSLAQNTINSFNAELAQGANIPFILSSLTFTEITDSAITGDNSTGYTIIIDSVTGTGLSTGSTDAYTVSGSATITINVANRNLEVQSVIGIAAVDIDSIQTILIGVNDLSFYMGVGIVSDLATGILNMLNIALMRGTENFTISTLMFERIESSNIVGNTTTGYVVSISSLEGNGRFTPAPELETVSGTNVTIAINSDNGDLTAGVVTNVTISNSMSSLK